MRSPAALLAPPASLPPQSHRFPEVPLSLRVASGRLAGSLVRRAANGDSGDADTGAVLAVCATHGSVSSSARAESPRNACEERSFSVRMALLVGTAFAPIGLCEFGFI